MNKEVRDLQEKNKRVQFDIYSEDLTHKEKIEKVTPEERLEQMFEEVMKQNKQSIREPYQKAKDLFRNKKLLNKI